MKKSLLVLWLCSFVVLHAAKIKTRAESDPQFSFAGVRTWAWTPAGAGDVYVARTSTDDPAPVKKRVDPLIVAAVGKEAAPDITFHYYVLVTIGMNAQVFGQFLPAVPEWGVPPFTAGTQSLDIVTRGSIVLDAFSTKLNRVVWRGVAQTDLDYAPTDAQREQVIRDAAHELIKRLPLKK